MDEIGLVVTHIDDKGFIWFGSIGGWDPQILVGQRVEIVTKDGPVAGVAGRKPIHLLEEEQRKKVVELKQLHIDIGAEDGDAARELVRIGDPAVIRAEPMRVQGSRLVSRSMDNRLGSYVALEVARRCAESDKVGCRVAGVANAQEEIGLYGARTAAYDLKPTLAIAVDVTHATDAPGIDENQEGSHHLGTGPVISRGCHALAEGLRAARGCRGRIRYSPHVCRLGQPHRHGRRRHPALPPRNPDGARLDPAPLHALAGRDGGPGRRREHGRPAGRVRRVARRGRRPQPLALSGSPERAGDPLAPVVVVELKIDARAVLVAGAAADHVGIPVLGMDPVRAASAPQDILSGVALDPVAPAPAGQTIVAVGAADPVRSAPSRHAIGRRRSVESLVAVAEPDGRGVLAMRRRRRLARGRLDPDRARDRLDRAFALDLEAIARVSEGGEGRTLNSSPDGGTGRVRTGSASRYTATK